MKKYEAEKGGFKLDEKKELTPYTDEKEQDRENKELRKMFKGE